MKYTNKHLKKSYKFNQVAFYISFVGFVIGTFILAFGFIRANIQMDNIRPLEEVLTEQSNHANKVAYIDIIKVPEKISEDKYEEYYLVTTEKATYISGMQKKQFEALKEDVETNGTARLEGFTKVIIDEQVKSDVQKYLDKENIHIRVTELTYGGILKEGYLVNLVLGGIIAIFSLIFMIIEILELKKYKHPQAKIIDEECNHKDAIWLDEYNMYLTHNFIVAVHNGIDAIDIGKVAEVRLFDTFKDGRTIRKLEAKLADNNTVPIYKTSYIRNWMSKEDIEYMTDIFRKKNIVFTCEIEPEDYEEDDEDVFYER